MAQKGAARPKDVQRHHSKSITREMVIDAALALVDAHGEDHLTMRRLADAMGVYPTTIYWHAGNKAALLAAVCERVFADISLPDSEHREWDEWIREMAHSVRQVLFSHRNLVNILRSQLQVTISSFALIEGILRALKAAGFVGRDLVDAYNTVVNSVFGFVFGELAAEPAGASADWATRFRDRLEAVDGRDAPTLRSALPDLAGEAFMLRWESGTEHPLQRSFDVNIDVLLAGLKFKLDQARAESRTHES